MYVLSYGAMPIIWTICAVVDVSFFIGKLAVMWLFFRSVRGGWGH